MFPRLSLTLLSLFALAAANPIDEKLQPIIAYKNNIGLVNPPTANAASGRAFLPVSGAALAVGVVAVLL